MAIHFKIPKWVFAILILLAAVLLFLNQRAPVVYREFAPQAGLNSFRLEYEDGRVSEWSESDRNIYSGAEDFIQNIGKCNFYGTLHQSDNSLMNLNFDTDIPDLENESMRILKEYGEIKYDESVDITPKTFDFDFFACQYKLDSWIPLELQILQTDEDRDCLFGYVTLVYVSPTDQKVEKRLYDGGEIVIPTRKGLYHLKQFCVFSVYDQMQPQPADQNDYYITVNGTNLAGFSIPAH